MSCKSLMSRQTGNLNRMIWYAANQRIATVDALSNRTTSSFAANGWNTAIQDARGYVTSFVRDAAGQQICVVDANGGRLTSLYDLRGIVYATQDQLGAFTSFSHDAVGNTTLRVDARNWATTYTNDPLNRPAQTVYIDGTRVTNTWNGAGEQTTSQDVTGVTSMGYDLNGRNVYQQFPTGISLTNTFDGANNRLTQADPWGVTSNTYDLQIRLTGIVNPLNERTTILWDALNREQTKTLANGMVVNHLYDANGNELVLSNVNAVGAAIAVFTNTYSATNNRTTVLELDGTRVTFGYDATSQLTLEQRSGAQAYDIQYAYDPNGNRLTQTSSGAITNYKYNAANAQVLITPPTGAPTTQLFDPNGNLQTSITGSAATTNTWDAENRLQTMNLPDGTSERHSYSHEGLRKSTTSGSTTTQYTWSGSYVVLETDLANSLQIRYTNFENNWCGLISQSFVGESSFFGFDSQRSVRALVSFSGSTSDAYSYTAFGVTIDSGSGTVNYNRFLAGYGFRSDSKWMLYAPAGYYQVLSGQWLGTAFPSHGLGWEPRVLLSNSPAPPTSAPTVEVIPKFESVWNKGHLCGDASFRIKWDLKVTPKSAKVSGWLVQHIKRSADVHECKPCIPCKDAPVKASREQSLHKEIWEAWEVKNGKFVQSASDQFSFTEEGLGTCGSKGIVGYARFISDPSDPAYVKFPPWIKDTDPGHPEQVGILPVLLPPGPPNWSDKDTAMHQVTVDWNCCTVPYPDETIITVPPADPKGKR